MNGKLLVLCLWENVATFSKKLMKFRQVENPGEIDFTLPEDHPLQLNYIKFA